MTEERKTELYDRLVKEIEEAHKEGRSIGTRWAALCVLCDWTGKITRDEVDLIEKLYEEGWVDA